MSSKGPIAEAFKTDEHSDVPEKYNNSKCAEPVPNVDRSCSLDANSSEMPDRNGKTISRPVSNLYSPNTSASSIGQMRGDLPLHAQETANSIGFDPTIPNFISAGYGLQYQHWPIEASTSYASNFFAFNSSPLTHDATEQHQYSYISGTRMCNPHSPVTSPVQLVPRNARRPIMHNQSRRPSWTGFYQNRVKKAFSHSFKPQTTLVRELAQAPQPETKQPDLRGDPRSTVTTPQASDNARPAAMIGYGTLPPTPVFSSPPFKHATIVSLEVLAKLNTGCTIPPPVPSLFVGASVEEALEQSLYNPNQTTNVYIRGLPPDTTDEKLLAICERFGSISSSKAIVDIQTGLCKGFGFACYDSEVDATACIAGLIHCGYQVSFAKESFSTRLKNLQDPQSTNLYLSNLPLHMHEKDLEEMFQPYKVVSNRILRDSNNLSRGVGFARLADRVSAQAVIDKFDNTCISGSSDELPLQVRFADSPHQKRLKGQTQRRRQWRAREYNLLTGHLGLEDLSSTNPSTDVSQYAFFASSSGPLYDQAGSSDDYFPACFGVVQNFPSHTYEQAQFVPAVDSGDDDQASSSVDAISRTMADQLTI